MLLETITAIGSVIVTLLLMMAVFVGAYYFSKFVANGYQGNTGANSLGNIEIIERRMIGKDQSLLVVKIEDKFWLISATPHNINKIDVLEGEAFTKTPTTPTTPPNFFTILTNIRNKNSSGQNEEKD